MQYFSYFTLIRLSFCNRSVFFIINNLSQKEKRVALTTKKQTACVEPGCFSATLLYILYIFLTNKFGLYLKCCFNINEKSHDGKNTERQLVGEFSPHKTHESPSHNSSWVFTNSRSFFYKVSNTTFRLTFYYIISFNF